MGLSGVRVRVGWCLVVLSGAYWGYSWVQWVIVGFSGVEWCLVGLEWGRVELSGGGVGLEWDRVE